MIRRQDLNTFLDILALACSQHLYFPSVFLISVLASCLRAASRSHFRAGERSGLNCAHLQVGAFWPELKWSPRSAAAAAIMKPSARRRIICSAAQRARTKMKGSLQNVPLSVRTCAGGLTFAQNHRLSTRRTFAFIVLYTYVNTHTRSPLMCAEDYSKFAGFL